MKICKTCGGTCIITVTEIDKKGNKVVIHFCNDCGNRSDRVENIVMEESDKNVDL